MLVKDVVIVFSNKEPGPAADETVWIFANNLYCMTALRGVFDHLINELTPNLFTCVSSPDPVLANITEQEIQIYCSERDIKTFKVVYTMLPEKIPTQYYFPAPNLN